MNIAHPPAGAFTEDNLCKQAKVVKLVYSPHHDVMLPAVKLSVGDINAAHSEKYVLDVLAGRVRNGFMDTDPRKLQHAWESCAAQYSASLAALLQQSVAFAPVSGFHHAGFSNSGGYCTFNGLIIAALKLRGAGQLPRGLLIIDGDAHYGDGTQDIIDNLGLDWVKHVTLANLNAGTAGQAVQSALLDQNYSLVMYQAGADCHIDDPFGAGYLTDSEWVARDLEVFELCKRMPIVFNLAGGYNGSKTLSLHCKTFLAAEQVFYPDSPRLIHRRRAS